MCEPQLPGMAFAVPQVMTHRIARLAMAGHSPSERDRKAVANAKRLARTRLRWGLAAPRLAAAAGENVASLIRGCP